MNARVDESCLVVTGATRGIGRSIAERAIDRGRRVVGIARDAASLVEAERTLGAGFVGVPCDLASIEDRAGLVGRIVERAGAVPGEFVHSAGVVHYAAALDTTSTSLREHFELHVVAGFELTRELARLWTDASIRGSVVMVSSTLATRPAPFTLAYATAKGAMEAMVRGLSLELAPQGIRVNAVAPGVVDTDMTRGGRPDGIDSPDERLATLARLHPLGRIGRPSEIADAVLHVLDASFMTGAVLVVDGGLLVG